MNLSRRRALASGRYSGRWVRAARGIHPGECLNEQWPVPRNLLSTLWYLMREYGTTIFEPRKRVALRRKVLHSPVLRHILLHRLRQSHPTMPPRSPRSPRSPGRVPVRSGPSLEPQALIRILLFRFATAHSSHNGSPVSPVPASLGGSMPLRSVNAEGRTGRSALASASPPILKAILPRSVLPGAHRSASPV